jgi:hypothetical protein
MLLYELCYNQIPPVGSNMAEIYRFIVVNAYAVSVTVAVSARLCKYFSFRSLTGCQAAACPEARPAAPRRPPEAHTGLLGTGS